MASHAAFTLFALGGYLFGVFFLSVGYYLRSKTRRHLPSALVAKGKVVSLETAPVSLGSDLVGRPVQPVFTFRDVQGIEYRVCSAVASYPAVHRIGDVVEVFYYPQSPHEAIIDPREFSQMTRIFLVRAF